MKACSNCGASYPAGYTHCPRDGNPLVETSDWCVGTVVRGKYKVLALVGHGGMGDVYKALHMRFEELRALKVMSRELAHDNTFVRRFEQEAIITRKLTHPNAVRVDDIDEAEDGRPFIVMEYVEGQSLKAMIQQEGPMPVARACSIVKQIAAALHAAHGLGMVHRDIKPANVVLVSGTATASADHPADPPRDHPIAKVLDFGIAKIKEAHVEDNRTVQTTLTGTGMVVGTPAYMSPEQARGMKGDQLDGRSDLYSLGVVMYQMLVGELPFKADTSMEWLLAHIQTPPKPLWEARPDLQIPRTLANVVMRCLEKDRLNRPASGAALIEEIEQAERGAWSAPAWPDVQVGPDMASVIASVATNPESGGTAIGPVSAQPAVLQPVKAEGVSRPSRARAGWAAGVAVAILVAGGILFWRIEHATLRSPTQSISNAPIHKPASPSSPADAPPGNATTSPPSDQPASQTIPATSPGPNSGSSGAPAKPTVEEKPAAEGEAANSEVYKAPPVERPPKEVLRQRDIADAITRAREDENQGKFEDALKEYQQASRLDPSSPALRRNIQRLKNQISKENDLIK